MVPNLFANYGFESAKSGKGKSDQRIFLRGEGVIELILNMSQCDTFK